MSQPTHEQAKARTRRKRGLRANVATWDTAESLLGFASPNAHPLEVAPDYEMAAVAINLANHALLPDVNPYLGDCADWDPSPLEERADVGLFVLIASGGDTLTAAAKTLLASYGLNNTVLGAGDKLIFAGKYGLEPLTAHEIHLTSGDTTSALSIVGTHLVGARYQVV